MNDRQRITDLLDFIAASPTCFHAVKTIRGQLLENGFRELSEDSLWQLQPGDCCFVRRNDSSLIAFRVPEGPLQSLKIAAAHTDSPCFKIKGLDPEIAVDGQYLKLNTEPYGGMLMAPWLDRPLSVAGRVVVRTPQGPESRLIHIDRELLLIPNVAIHMNREVNKGKEYNPQIDLLPLFAECGDPAEAGPLFRQLIAENAGVSDPEDLLSADLFVYSRSPGSIWGANEEFFSAPRLDDLECVYALSQGFLQALQGSAKGDGCLKILALFDNEEVGSRTPQGADSTFVTDTLSRVREALAAPRQNWLAAAARGWMISADNAHALHPNHPELHDPQNHPVMNGGPVLKYTASQRYATTAVSAALFKELCRSAGVPCQEFYNRSDIPGGSTLGTIFDTHLSIRTVDIGLAQLAMHSPYETAGTRDLPMLIRVMKEFFA
ncbi:MAG: M18 family aminopeptidase [Mogibacterium sp.]|nr:M18 family aminopeptidase [Mogibacterium sp.]